MSYLIIGSSSFILFLLHDLNANIIRSRIVASFFAVGSAVLVISSGLMAFTDPVVSISTLGRILGSFFSLVFLFLLFHTLFLALPFRRTYIQQPRKGALVDRGVYALCRHPGVLWLFFLYLSLGFAFGRLLLFLAAVVYTLLNIGYILLQESLWFPERFKGYAEYKKRTPFLIPNPTSIRACIRTIRHERMTL